MKLHLKNNQVTATIGAMLCVENAPDYFIKDVLRQFTFRNPAYDAAMRFSPHGRRPEAIPQHIYLAFHTALKDSVVFPRGIQVDLLRHESQEFFARIKWRDARSTAPCSFPTLQISPNVEQEQMRAAVTPRSDIRPFGNYLFQSPTGTGKTIGQSMCAAFFGQRTMILVDTDQVKRTWYGDLRLGYGLEKEEIGLIQRDIFRIGETFTIASIKTLSRRVERWEELVDTIGTIILDEVDLCSAPSFHEFILSFPARYIIGATATISPKDFHLKACFGTPVVKIAQKSGNTKTSIAIREAKTIDTDFKFEYQEQNIDYAALTLAMALDEARNELIVNNVSEDYEKGETCLIVTKRLSHVHILYDLLIESGFSTLEVNVLSGETNLDREATDKLVRRIFKGKVKVVVASAKAVMRGANLNPLSAIHLTMPFNRKDLEQLLGRIRRKHEGKTMARVRYYVDKKVGYLHSQYKNNAVPVFRKMKIKNFENLYLG